MRRIHVRSYEQHRLVETDRYSMLAQIRYAQTMMLEKFPEVQQLTPSEKLIFVSELWNDLEAKSS